MITSACLLGETIEDQFWGFVIEMYFLGLGIALGTAIGYGMSDMEPESK